MHSWIDSICALNSKCLALSKSNRAASLSPLVLLNFADCVPQSIEMMLFCYHQPVQSFPSKTSGSRYFLQHNIYKIWRGSDESQVEWGCDSERELRWFVVFLLVSGLKGLAKSCVRVLNSLWRNLSPWLDPEKTKQRKRNKILLFAFWVGAILRLG